MSKERKEASSGAASAAAAAAAGYDPAALLALYGMSASGSNYGASAASAYSASNASATAAATGLNQWWAMASQLAAQEYLTRIQSAARDPQAYAALAAQGLVPNYDEFKRTSSTTGAKEPGNSTRGRKKTISLDPNLSSVDYAHLAANVSNSSGESTPPAIPSCLTIERKRPGSTKSSEDRASPAVDRVEITKIPASTANGSSSPFMPKSSTPKSSSVSASSAEGGALNLSTKSFAPPFMSSPISEQGASTASAAAASEASGVGTGEASSASLYTSKSIGGSKIPQEYYASQALSGVFLAEQIRQQQLAAALESRLDSQSFSAMQAALLMNKLKAMGSTAAAASAASAASFATSDSSSSGGNKKQSRKKNSAAASAGMDSSKLSKNTVANLLAASRFATGGTSHHNESNSESKPELTIEPIFRGYKPDQSSQSGDEGSVTSTVEDGKLKIKTVSETPEIRNLSDQSLNHHEELRNNASGTVSGSESDDGSESKNSVDRTNDVVTTQSSKDTKQQQEQSNSKQLSNNCAAGRAYGKYATVETEELRCPLKMGWKREITVREYSKSGIRGDVLYYAPCGKKFKQYPDIMRYLEKKGVKSLHREHFSFSTKVFIGDFLKPTGMRDSTNGEEKYARLTEKEMYEDIDKLRRENGWKPRRRGSSTSKSKNSASETTSSSTQKNQSQSAAAAASASNQAAINAAAMAALLGAGGQTGMAEALLKMQAEMQMRSSGGHDDQAANLRLQQEALRILAEAERLEKIKEKEAAKRRRHEEIQRQKQEEQLRKIQEREQKRQHNALIKEQAKQYEQLLYHQTMERERRKQHMILMKQLEAKKRSDERERKREDMRLKSEREREKRMEQKRLEVEVITEMRKPIEDMSLDDHKEMPELKRIQGLRLSGEAFANTLMIYEFLHNFGDCLGFDMDSLPTLDSLQAAFLYDQEAEEELLSVVIHLVICATEDPGIPFFLKQLTILGQNLRQADITNTNISEILKIYLTARGQAEVKIMHNSNPPEMLHAKDPRRETQYTPEKIEEYNELLKKTRGFKYAQMVQDKSFLCLNPTDKTELVSFICNELLGNKRIMKQIDDNVENVGRVKKDKWEVEAHLKRLKIIQAKKARSQVIAPEQVTEEVTENGDDTKDDVSEISEQDTKKGGKNKKKNTRSGKKKVAEVPEEDMETETPHDNTANAVDLQKENAEDEKLTPEELQKKIDKTARKLVKKRDELAFISNRVRVNDLGQDRYRRRYHHFAFAGGIYVEALESAEPWKLETSGMPHFDEDDRSEVREKGSEENGHEVKEESENQSEIKSEGDQNDDEEEEMEIDDNEEEVNKENVKDEPDETKEALAKLSNEILVTPKVNAGSDVKFLPKVTANGEKLNMFNHSSSLNMTLSPVVLNGAVTITPKDQQSSYPSTISEKPWFSILPLGNPIDHQAKFIEAKENSFCVDSITPQINALEAKLEELRSIDLEQFRNPVPQDKCHGWWRLSEADDVNKLEANLNIRGAREQHLLSSIKRNFDLLRDVAKKQLPDHMTMEPPEGYEDLDGEHPMPDPKGHWSKEVALRVDKYILEQVEALEDKVAAASMQVPGWKVPNKEDVDKRTFRPACLYNEGEVDLKDEYGPEATNPVEEARERLMDLELNIERRYLKAPLGSANKVNLQTIENSMTKKPDESLDETNENENQEEEDGEEEESPNTPQKSIPRGLQFWREGVKNAKTAAQLAMAFYVLETSIAWQKSIMKAYCQLCNNGDNEDSLLLCDGCDKGYHTYCFKPSLTNIPDGDWYCYECINKATGLKHCLVCGKQEGKNLIECITCPRAYHISCLSPPLSKVIAAAKKVRKVPRGKWQCPGCNQKGPKKSKSRKKGPPTHLLHNADSDESPEQTNANSPATTEPEKVEEVAEEPVAPPDVPEEPKEEKNGSSHPPPPKKRKMSKMDKDLTICHTLISEMEAQEHAWPFMFPVNTKQFPTYKKVIKSPMDITTIKNKCEKNVYKFRDEFVDDVRLIFSNCERFNEDDSPVGKAGHAMRSHFESRWAELTA